MSSQDTVMFMEFLKQNGFLESKYWNKKQKEFL